MTTPNIGLETVPTGVLQPSVPVNDSFQALDALVHLSVETVTSAPPATLVGDIGKRWLVGAGATGAWAGQDDAVALCTGADEWRFFAPTEGWYADVRDVDALYRFDGAAWSAAGGGGGYAAVTAIAAAAHNLLASNAGQYLRFTAAEAKTLTVQDESTEPLPADAEFHGRNAGASDLTIVEDTAVTVNPPAGGTLVIPQGGTFTLKRVAADEFDLIGVTVAA